jgi:hypothetical protein
MFSSGLTQAGGKPGEPGRIGHAEQRGAAVFFHADSQGDCGAAAELNLPQQARECCGRNFNFVTINQVR